MSGITLVLKPDSGKDVTIHLQEMQGERKRLDNLAHFSGTNQHIFSDCRYVFQLTEVDMKQIEKVDIYINDVHTDCYLRNDEILFPEQGESGQRKIFYDSYGFVQIRCELLWTNGQKQKFQSQYLAVLVPQNDLNYRVNQMVKYLYQHQDEILSSGNAKTENPVGIGEEGDRSLEVRIILAEDIAVLYESSYSYFKANARFHMQRVPKVDNLERMQYVSAETVRYVAAHPEQLRQINSHAGIRVGKHVYQPQKVLSLQNERSYDIYENKIIVRFLKKMLEDIKELQTKMKTFLQNV